MKHARWRWAWAAGVGLVGLLAVVGCVSSRLSAQGQAIKARGTISLDVDEDFKVTKVVVLGEEANTPDYEILLDDKSAPLTGMFGARVEVTGKMGKVKRRPVLILDSYKVLEP